MIKFKSAISSVLVSILLVACSGGGASGATPSASSLTSSSDPYHGIAVPPEPDHIANNATLLGIDSNNNGVRDDVERQLAIKYGANAGQYAAAMQMARADQNYLIANGDPVKSTAATIAAGDSGVCMLDQLNGDGIAADKAIDYVSPLTINSYARMKAYQATSQASTEVVGHISESPCQ